jgi:acetyl esterase/lipase
MTLSWIYFSLSIVGLLLTINALKPLGLGPFAVLSFFPGWLTSELPIVHLIGQAVVSAIFIDFGSDKHWPGQVGLAITLVSWIGLIALEVSSHRAWKYISAGLESLASNKTKPQLRFTHTRLPVPAKGKSIEKLPNIDYWGDSIKPHMLDIYRSNNHTNSAATVESSLKPVLFYIHGGAWILGDKREQGLPMIYHMAAQGWVCVTINYRLSPRSAWPDHIVDCKRALVWVKENISAYGGDPDKIVVSGGSAGGHLAALVGLSPNDPDFQPGFEDKDTSVMGCVPIYGVYDFTNQAKSFAPGFVKFVEKKVFKKKLIENLEDFQAASPYYRIHPQAPPFLMLAGRNDTLVPVREARRFYYRLKEVSTSDVFYIELPFAQHAFEIFPSVRSAQAVRAVELFLEYLASNQPKVGSQ